MSVLGTNGWWQDGGIENKLLFDTRNSDDTCSTLQSEQPEGAQSEQ